MNRGVIGMALNGFVWYLDRALGILLSTKLYRTHLRIIMQS
jgi:hypothetical protein